MRVAVGLSFLVAVLALLPIENAAATDDELVVKQDQRTSLNLTVYEQSPALVEDRRIVKLTEGLNRIAFTGVSAQLQPSSVLIETGTGEPLRLIEQRYEANIISPRALLEASLGHDVRVAIRNPATGEEKIETATVLSIQNGVVLKIGDRVESPPGRLIFSSVPPSLRERPTLVLAATSLKSGSAPIEVAYLTSGVNWSANYVAQLDASERTLSLAGRASVSNTSGATYENAKLTLVAGSPNRVSEPKLGPTLAMATGMATARAAAAPAPEPVGDYYRYPIDRAITLGDKETIQLTFLDASAVPVMKEYRLEEVPPVTMIAGGEPNPLQLQVRLLLDNKAAGGLGVPLPRGTVRVFRRGSDGTITLLGEDNIGATPAGRPIKLTLGRAFDVTGERRQTSFNHPSEKSFETGQEITLRNAKDKPVTVTLVENMLGTWRIIEESEPHTSPTAASAMWQIEVPAKGERKLTYRVITHY